MADDRRKPLQSSSARSGSQGQQSGHEPHKRGLNINCIWPWVRIVPVRALVTQGTTADCTQAVALIDGCTAEKLLADKGYDTDVLLARAEKQGMSPVIPPKKNRKDQRDYDKKRYKARHLAENAVSSFETVAWYCHRICEEHSVISGRCPHQGYLLWASIS